MDDIKKLFGYGFQGSPVFSAITLVPPLGVNYEKPGAPTLAVPSSFRLGLVNGSSGSSPVNGGDLNDNPMNNVTPGLMSNTVTNYQKIVKPFADLPVILLSGHLLIEKKIKDEKQGRTRFKTESRKYTVYPIQFWNYLEHKKQRIPQSRDDIKTPAEHWKDYSIYGGVKHVTGVNNEYTLRQLDKSETSLTTTIRGQSYMFNIWGNQIKSGTRLYLILKKVVSQGKYRLDPLVADLNVVDLNVYTDRPYQLIPWCSLKDDYPPLDALKFYDEFGFEHIGLVIYVGRADELRQPIEAPHRRGFTFAPFDISSVTGNSNKIMVLIDT